MYPVPAGLVTVPEVYAVASRPRPHDRPWVGICMVASIDGSAALAGTSGGLSSSTDALVLRTLREAADVIVVGAGTVRTEGYGPPRKPGQRVGVVTSRGIVDASSPLFASGAGFVITTHEAPDPGVDTLRAGRGRVDLAEAIARLDADFVQAEGGPTLNAALLEQGLVDEVNLTVSPALVGGSGPRLTTGSPEGKQRMGLASVCDDDGFVFLRYVRV